MNEKFNIALDVFLDKWRERIDAYFAANFESLNPPKLLYKIGKKYVKVSKCEGSSLIGSVDAFIDMSTGDVFKSASCNAPAKHKRGNIFSDLNGMEAIDTGGYIKYLRR